MRSTFRSTLYRSIESQYWVVHKSLDPFDVYIGRASTDTYEHFGNPFGHHLNSRCSVLVNSAQEAIARNDSWLRGKSDQDLDQNQRQWILRNLNSLRGKRLGCFCARKNGVGLNCPKVCHGQNYLQILSELDQGILRLIKEDDNYILLPRNSSILKHLGVLGPTYSKLTGVQREKVRFDLMGMLLTLQPNSTYLHVGDCNGVDKLVRDGIKTTRLRSTTYRKNPLLSDKVQVGELTQQLMEGLRLQEGQICAWVNEPPPRDLEPSDEMDLATSSSLWQAISYAVSTKIPLALYPLVSDLNLPAWVPKSALACPSFSDKTVLHQKVVEILTQWLFLSGSGNSAIKKTVEDRCYGVTQMGHSIKMSAMTRDCPIFQVEKGEVTLDLLVTEDLENLIRLNHQLISQIASKTIELAQQVCCVFGVGEFNTGRIAYDDRYQIYQAKGVLTVTAHDGRRTILKAVDGQTVFTSMGWDDFTYFLKVQEHIREHGRPKKIIDVPIRQRQSPLVKVARI
jgi:hypothetical protein